MMASKDIVLSGMRPSGKLHLGNYFGALHNWLDLQKQFRSFFMIADWHALTSEYADTSNLEANIWDMALDWLSAGLDPKTCVIFRQSWVPEHAELHLLLSMITPVSWLERNPTYKEQMQEMKHRDLSTYGFLGYPVLQSADVLIYRATRVPVGEDQLPHLELTRELARRFNHLYGQTVPEPQAILSKSPKVLGIDGRKMSKSYDNAVLLSDSRADVEAKVKTMYTDPKKIRLGDKGNPYGCSVFANHKLFTPEAPEIEERCKSGALGCVACKKRLMETLNDGLEPMRANRAEWSQKGNAVKEIVQEGSRVAKAAAQETMSVVRSAMKLSEAPL